MYALLGQLANPSILTKTALRFPHCLKFMPYAEPVVDLQEINEARARFLKAAYKASVGKGATPLTN